MPARKLRRGGEYVPERGPWAGWRRYWLDNKTFRTPEFKDLDTSKPKFYVLDMFPYPRHARHLLACC